MGVGGGGGGPGGWVEAVEAAEQPGCQGMFLRESLPLFRSHCENPEARVGTRLGWKEGAAEKRAELNSAGAAGLQGLGFGSDCRG